MNPLEFSFIKFPWKCNISTHIVVIDVRNSSSFVYLKKLDEKSIAIIQFSHFMSKFHFFISSLFMLLLSSLNSNWRFWLVTSKYWLLIGWTSDSFVYFSHIVMLARYLFFVILIQYLFSFEITHSKMTKNNPLKLSTLTQKGNNSVTFLLFWLCAPFDVEMKNSFTRSEKVKLDRQFSYL